MIRTSKVFVFFFLTVEILCSFPAQGEPWWNLRWPIRRQVAIEPEPDNTRTGRQGAWATILTGGECKPDGADFRVTGIDGRPVKYWVMSVGPGDLARIAFETKGTAKQRLFIYYGNPQAEAEKNEWRPQGGLLLETWKYAGGSIGTPEAIKSAVELAQSAPVLGRAYIPAVFIGENIFGPEPQTCNRYSGNFFCRQNGTYQFAISSIDASTLYVDDRLVISWPGRHHWVGDTRHQGKIELKTGLHQLKIYHVNLAGHGGMVAAWSTPAGRPFRVLEAENFLPIGRGKLGPLEKRHKDFTADFTYQQAGFASIKAEKETPLYRYAFTALNPPSGKNVEFRWNFPDGQTATGTDVDHVFFREGIVEVKLFVQKGRIFDQITQRIYIGPNRLTLRATPDQLSKFEPALSNCRFSEMPAEDVLTAMDFFLLINRPEKAVQAGRSILEGGQKAQNQPLEPWVALAGKVADLMIDNNGNDALAAKVLEKSARHFKPGDPAYRQLTALAASIYINVLGNDKKAETLLNSCPGQTTQPGKTLDPLLCIAWGDLFRLRANRPLAERFYKQAESKTDREKQPARSGGYVTAVEDYLRRGEYPEARKLLDRWQHQDPMQRLGGYSCLLRYRLYLKQNRLDHARRLAKILTEIDPFGIYTRQIAKETP